MPEDKKSAAEVHAESLTGRADAALKRGYSTAAKPQVTHIVLTAPVTVGGKQTAGSTARVTDGWMLGVDVPHGLVTLARTVTVEGREQLHEAVVPFSAVVSIHYAGS